MMTARIPLTLAAGTLLLAAPASGQESHRHHRDGPGHGHVEFAVSCAADVRPAFERAVAILHSFGYEEARRAFTAIAEQDPACGMAHWGVAMSYWHPMWAMPTSEELAAGSAAAERAAGLGAQSERERAYIAAIGQFYRDADRRDHRTRAAAYRDAMGQLVQKFPDDDEASIFYALGILGAAPPSDPKYTAQRRAAEMLAALLPGHPTHPGIAHYTIHAFDYPELAELALPAARVYADIAPESPHARHMPTHIFTRLGLWDESIRANLDCDRIAGAGVAETHAGATAFEAVHCKDYLAYAYLQLGEDGRARQVMDELTAARRFDNPNLAVGYALLAVPARYALERRDWVTAAKLEDPGTRLPWHDYPYAHAITYFANAVGAARAGDVERARRAVARLGAVHAAVAADPPGGPYDWAGRLEALKLAGAGWLAFAEGQRDDATRLLTAAAEREEQVGKHPVTPGAILPARELLGDLLLELNRPQEALAAYEAALAQAPRRFNALLGAARAARSAEQPDVAARYYHELIELAGESTTRSRELAEARAFLKGRNAR